MRSKKLFLVLLLLGVLMLWPGAAWAPMPSYMQVTGEQQGDIEGSVTQKDREGTILVYAFGHNIKIPTDPQSGLPTGKRIHGPIKILKEFDKSSPKLYKALVTGEHLNPVIIKFYRIDPTGNEEHYFTIRLEDAIILSISPSIPTTLLAQNESYGHMETVSFNYRKIKWTWEPDGVESEDDWTVPK